MSRTTPDDVYNMHDAWKAQECGPREMAEWIVRGWRESRSNDRVLIIAITEALKVIPATVGDLEAEVAALRKELGR